MSTRSAKPHHTPSGFRNNDPTAGFAFADFLRWRKERKQLNPKRIAYPIVRSDVDLLRPDAETPTFTWLGHATFLLQYRGVNILTDPHFGSRSSPVPFAGPLRLTPVAVPLNELPSIDLIVMSHNHYDHLDGRSIRMLRKRQAERPPAVVAPLGLGRWFVRRRFTEIMELDWWEEAAWRDWSIQAVPAQHFSGRTPRNYNRTLWAGFVLRCGEFSFYFVGDSGWTEDFHEIGLRCGPIQVAAIPIAAYEPRWIMRPIHINPEEAVMIHQAVTARESLAMHWGTFPLADEDMDEPLERLKTARAAAGITAEQFRILQHGETHGLKMTNSE